MSLKNPFRVGSGLFVPLEGEALPVLATILSFFDNFGKPGAVEVCIPKRILTVFDVFATRNQTYSLCCVLFEPHV